MTCVDKHKTHADGFCEYVKEKEILGEVGKGQISFLWEDLELRKFSEKYNCIFFNHVASFIQDRVSLYGKFRDSLTEDGTFICTWGGLLLTENLWTLLQGFLDDIAPLEAGKKKYVSTITQYEKELREVFETVERHSYVTTLQFETAEDYMDYILQIGKPVEAELEERRTEFLEYLRNMRNPEGGYTFVRDTYLYRCRREV